jgi:hypothetical protein
VIGPWDGINPHDYAVNNRDAALRDSNAADMHNAYDHMAGSYYNFDNGEYMFYSPTDVAVVRERWDARLEVDTNGDGDALDAGDIRANIFEPAGNYAKYLNDVSNNDFWDDGQRPAGNGWDILGGYQFDVGSPYSRWAFDARNYFSYEGGSFQIQIDALNNSVAVNPLTLPGTPGEARNKMAVISSNGETAYSYIPNPPFRSLFDLYKVIDDSANANTFGLTLNQMTLALDRTTATSGWVGNNAFANAQRFSGPSLFRYTAHWDDDLGEFVPVQNYLDDIAQFVTCRSYVFRVDSAGAVVSSGGEAGSLVDSSKISRDRSKQAIIDVGKLYSRRSDGELSPFGEQLGLRSDEQSQRGYRILWFRDARE